YVDVLFTPTLGGSIDNATIVDPGAEFTLGGTTVVVSSETPLALGGGRYRYILSGAAGDFTTGVVTVSFGLDSFRTTGTPAYGNLDSTQSFTVNGPRAKLVDPLDGSVLGARELNDRGYVDVPFVVPFGSALDLSSVTDVATYDPVTHALVSANLEITLGGGFTGTLTVD